MKELIALLEKQILDLQDTVSKLRSQLEEPDSSVAADDSGGSNPPGGGQPGKP